MSGIPEWAGRRGFSCTHRPFWAILRRVRDGVFLLVFAVSTSAPALLLADPAAPKEFYERNFASAPGRPSGGAEEARRRSGPRDASRPDRKTPSADSGRVHGQRPGERKRKVMVTVVVNSLDHKHFAKVVENVTRLADLKRAFIVGVNHVGDYQAVTPEIKEQLGTRNISITQIDAPGPELWASVSPVWVITTPQGKHIAEGFLDIDRLIDSSGDYDPALGEERERSVAVEGF